MTNKPILKRISTWFIIIAALLLILFGGWLLYCHQNQRFADETTLAALQSTDEVFFTDSTAYYIFTPTLVSLNQGVIIYPGAFIPAAAYAPLAQLLAADGYQVFIPHSAPFDLMIFNQNAAQTIITNHSQITNWTGLGHSLGGVALTNFITNHLEPTDNLFIDQVILLGSYPQKTKFNQYPGLVASVIGDQDGLLSVTELEQSRSHLPDSAAIVTIPGANHTDFANLTELVPDDLPAQIDRPQQQAAVLETLQILTGRYGTELFQLPG